jgi:hypothetical protein
LDCVHILNDQTLKFSYFCVHIFILIKNSGILWNIRKYGNSMNLPTFSKGGYLWVILEKKLRVNIAHLYISSCFPTWQAIFHVSNNASSHNVRVNVTCNIRRRTDWMSIVCSTECCAQCSSRRLCRRRALLHMLEVSMQDVLNDTQTNICMGDGHSFLQRLTSQRR